MVKRITKKKGGATKNGEIVQKITFNNKTLSKDDAKLFTFVKGKNTHFIVLGEFLGLLYIDSTSGANNMDEPKTMGQKLIAYINDQMAKEKDQQMKNNVPVELIKIFDDHNFKGYLLNLDNGIFQLSHTFTISCGFNRTLNVECDRFNIYTTQKVEPTVTCNYIKLIPQKLLSYVIESKEETRPLRPSSNTLSASNGPTSKILGTPNGSTPLGSSLNGSTPLGSSLNGPTQNNEGSVPLTVKSLNDLPEQDRKYFSIEKSSSYYIELNGTPIFITGNLHTYINLLKTRSKPGQVYSVKDMLLEMHNGQIFIHFMKLSQFIEVFTVSRPKMTRTKFL